jgi:hypothetical protein
MRPPRYPLETLAAQRARKVEVAVKGLAQAVASRERAEELRSEREQERGAHEAKAARVITAERQSLARGELCAADLARAHAWQLRDEAERAALQSEALRAATLEVQARESESLARDEVSAKRADADVVEKDRARWTAQAQKRADAKEEEAAAEAFRRRP